MFFKAQAFLFVVVLICAVTSLELPAKALTRAALPSIAKLALLNGGQRIIDGTVAPVVANRIADACGVLALIKIPAALFAGAALSALFSSDSKNACPTLRLSFVIFTALAFALHVCTVFCSTVLSWRLVGGGFNPAAESGAALLLHYFPFEYLSVGSFFFGGIFCFFLSNTVRAHMVFGNTREALACSIINALSTFFLLNFFDIAMVYFDNFGQFLCTWLMTGFSRLGRTRITWKLFLYAVVTIGANMAIAYKSSLYAAKFAEMESANLGNLKA
ncbi:hypothetical protein B484DRAFT_448758 [Ochromonadaceae sp. CCMP2298]|nr:hypothetical protein B484DRAFT_448758 [Ochromonadaceae sp. CCMP2298]